MGNTFISLAFLSLSKKKQKKQQKQLLNHTKIDVTWGKGVTWGNGGNNSIDMIFSMIFTSLFTSQSGSNNLSKIRFHFMIPSINDSTKSFMTMINGTLVQEIGGKKILEPFAVTLYSYEILLVLLEKVSPAFCTLFLTAF